MNNDDELINQHIADLVDAGALILIGMDGDEPYYHMVPEVMKIVSPELYNIMMEEVDETLMTLYEQGLVSIEYDENLNALFSLSEDGYKFVEEMINDD